MNNAIVAITVLCKKNNFKIVFDQTSWIFLVLLPSILQLLHVYYCSFLMLQASDGKPIEFNNIKNF
ncbi:MAG TPA: hypothetical protein VGI82_08235, partial [Chitinophagaceae bacterium]